MLLYFTFSLYLQSIPSVRRISWNLSNYFEGGQFNMHKPQNYTATNENNTYWKYGKTKATLILGMARIHLSNNPHDKYTQMYWIGALAESEIAFIVLVTIHMAWQYVGEIVGVIWQCWLFIQWFGRTNESQASCRWRSNVWFRTN